MGSLHAESPREGTRPTPTPLSKLNKKAQDERIRGDLAAVQIYRDGLRSVVTFAASRPDLFPAEKIEKPRVLRREEKETVWSTWKTFLDYVLALDSVGRYQRDFYKLKGEAEEKSFLAGYAGFLAEYRYAMEFIDRAENSPDFHTLLNEPVPELGLPKDSYAQLKFRFLNVARAGEFTALEATYKVIGGKQAPEVRKSIEEDRAQIWKMGRGRGETLTAKNALRVVQDKSFAAYFPVQAGVSEWMGDTKVVRKGVSLVSEEQIKAMTKRLEPGDVLLVRHEWYLSNIGLPGFWPHGVLFIGTPEDRKKYFDDPEVKAWVREQGQADGDFEALLRAKELEAYKNSPKPLHGEVVRVIEAISEGVAFNSMEAAADADSIVALRPRLPKREKAMAILRAFHYTGRPYDFNFDFRTDSAIVCTELVYKSYEPATGYRGLRFPMVEMLGRPVLPANEIAKQFDAQYGTPEQQFDMILFLDGQERERKAVEVSVAVFRESWKRPKWHVIVQDWSKEKDGNHE